MGEGLLDWLMDHVVPWILSLGIVLIVVLIIVTPFAIYQDSKAERLSLKKDSWMCTASHLETSTTYVKSGGGNGSTRQQ